MSAEQLDLSEYQRQLATAARDAGLQSAAASDPDLLDEVVNAITELAWTGDVFSADHVRSRVGPGCSSLLGVAFRKVARQGLIAPAGITVSDAVTRHRGLQRQWVGVMDVPPE